MQTQPVVQGGYQAEGCGNIVPALRTAPCLAAWCGDPDAQTARHPGHWYGGTSVAMTPDEDGASEVMTPGTGLLHTSYNSSVVRAQDPNASAAAMFMVESQASQVVEILGEIAEMSRAQRLSAAELEEERRHLAVREAAMRMECEEAQGLMKRLQAEVDQRRHARFEAESFSAELEEERQKSHAQRQAARRMRQRYERKLEEQAEELRRVLETAEYREQVQEATIGDLERRLSLVGETEEHSAANVASASSGQDTLQALPLVLEAPIQEASMPSVLESTRRRLFSPTVVLTPTSTAGEMMQWLFEGTIEHSTSAGSLLATSNLEPLVESTQDNVENVVPADQCAQEKTPKEAPPVGLVAEKVSIFEQRCHTPTQGVPAALRRGPRSVPTPFGSTRVFQDDIRQTTAGERISATPGFLRTSRRGSTTPLGTVEGSQLAADCLGG